MPAFAPVARWAAEFFIHFEVQAAADQLQALVLAATFEVFLQAAVHHDIRVQLIDIHAIGKHRLLEAQRQAFDLGVFAGIHLGEQQLEHRFVGRLDALEQLPHPRTNKFGRWDARQVAEVEHILCADKALLQQCAGVVRVARFFIDRHQPPKRRASAEPDGSAVELIE